MSNNDNHLKNIHSLGRFESVIPISAPAKMGKVVKPTKFAKSGAGQSFVFEGGVSPGISGKVPFWVESSLRR